MVNVAEWGDEELVRGEQEPSPTTELPWDMDERALYNFGLSFPVGPRPKSGRDAGGRLRAARSWSFSSSSSVTRSSSAYGISLLVQRNTVEECALGNHLQVSSTTRPESTLDVARPVGREVVIALPAAF